MMNLWEAFVSAVESEESSAVERGMMSKFKLIIYGSKRRESIIWMTVTLPSLSPRGNVELDPSGTHSAPT